MKDTEMHNGLDGKEMRNFYQETLIQYDLREIASRNKLDAEKTKVYQAWNDTSRKGLDGLRLRVKISELEAQHSNELFRVAECRLGLFLTMEGLGWADFDVSDYIAKSGERFRNFIGTKEEYNTLINSINKNG